MEEQIKNILSKFIKDRYIIELFVNDKTIGYWYKGLTHESINVKDNYERTEFLGDASVGYAFDIYMRDYQQVTNPMISNNLLNYYMSKKYQPTMCRKIGLADLVIIRPDIKVSDDILEDIFESFFGVYTIIGRHLWLKNKIRDPIYYLVSFFDWYFSTIGNFDIDKGKPDPKGIFYEYYRFFADEPSHANKTAYYNYKTGNFVFSPKFLDILGRYDTDLQRDIRKIVTTKGLEENQYYDQVVEAFQIRGYDIEWLNYEKERTSFKEFNDLAKSKDYSRFIFIRNNKESYDLISQKMEAITRKSITVDTLASFDDSEDFNTIKDKAREILSKL